MNKKEKEIKYLIYLKNELIKETKKELMQYRKELKTLGNSKTKKIKK